MSQSNLLILLARILAEEGIEYLVTGSMASAFHGEPRLSHDIDVVVVLHPRNARSLVARFESLDFYADEDSVLAAISSAGQCNFVHLPSSGKIDLWMLTHTPFDQSRFARRVSLPFQGETLWVSSAEDTILMKLVWDRECGGSPKQRGDVLRVYENQARQLDMEYLDDWAVQLGVADRLADIRRRAVIV